VVGGGGYPGSREHKTPQAISPSNMEVKRQRSRMSSSLRTYLSVRYRESVSIGIKQKSPPKLISREVLVRDFLGFLR